MQDSGSKKPKEGKCATPRKMPAPRWCPRGIIKTQKHRLQKMRQRELAEKKKRKSGSSGDSSGEEASMVTLARGEDNLGSGAGTRSWVTATWSRETATRNPATATWTRVTASRVRRMTGKERARS
jgi:hypothetical protein